MKLEDVMPYLRKGGTVFFRDVSVDPRSEVSVSLYMEDLLSDGWEASLTDEQILKIWEDDVVLRTGTGQHAQAALLRGCIKLLRTRRV